MARAVACLNNEWLFKCHFCVNKIRNNKTPWPRVNKFSWKGLWKGKSKFSIHLGANEDLRWIMWKMYCFLMNFCVYIQCLQCQLGDTLIPEITGYGVLSVSLQQTFDKWRSKNYCSKDVNCHGFTRKDHEIIWFLAEKIKKTMSRRININTRKKWLRKNKIENGI